MVFGAAPTLVCIYLLRCPIFCGAEMQISIGPNKHALFKEEKLN